MWWNALQKCCYQGALSRVWPVTALFLISFDSKSKWSDHLRLAAVRLSFLTIPFDIFELKQLFQFFGAQVHQESLSNFSEHKFIKNLFPIFPEHKFIKNLLPGVNVPLKTVTFESTLFSTLPLWNFLMSSKVFLLQLFVLCLDQLPLAQTLLSFIQNSYTRFSSSSNSQKSPTNSAGR